MESLDVFRFNNRENLLILGVMGGIASGKTTVTNEFAKYGAHVINADLVVREILQEKNTQQQIGETFPHIFPNANFDKKLLAQHVFSSRDNLKKLESILHPLVRLRIKNMLEDIASKGKEKVVVETGPDLKLEDKDAKLAFVDTHMKVHHEKTVVIIDAPLLWENGLHQGVDTLIFIDTPIELRRKRAETNRGWNNDELDRREKFQSDLLVKKQNSNYVIENENQQKMEQQVKDIWLQLPR
ncbi:dephospho-CoA kinase [Candidatus Uabimicrobium amorphum]|uniref:Dephospho-CoA kinase n=1 Tax=Uabimicrobium amorphum TaxID=2596890 RepID=A0A5S9II92_UABAM|nr:dephospho-CoA kinase [Candidatus Uabimicrobium amorphum]BBM82041.1 dephospho-CoA kinase [Candidatus Uabimicrobium amorphum]